MIQGYTLPNNWIVRLNLKKKNAVFRPKQKTHFFCSFFYNKFFFHQTIRMANFVIKFHWMFVTKINGTSFVFKRCHSFWVYVATTPSGSIPKFLILHIKCLPFTLWFSMFIHCVAQFSKGGYMNCYTSIIWYSAH